MRPHLSVGLQNFASGALRASDVGESLRGQQHPVLSSRAKQHESNQRRLAAHSPLVFRFFSFSCEESSREERAGEMKEGSEHAEPRPMRGALAPRTLGELAPRSLEELAAPALGDLAPPAHGAL